MSVARNSGVDFNCGIGSNNIGIGETLLLLLLALAAECVDFWKKRKKILSHLPQHDFFWPCSHEGFCLSIHTRERTLLQSEFCEIDIPVVCNCMTEEFPSPSWCDDNPACDGGDWRECNISIAVSLVWQHFKFEAIRDKLISLIFKF